MALIDNFPYTKHREVDNRLLATIKRSEIRSGPTLLRVNGGDNDLALLPRNLANRTMLGVTGTPAVNAGYVRTTGMTNFLRSTVLEPSGSYTIFYYGRRSDAATAVVLGTYSDNTNPGCVLWWNSTTTLRYQVTQGTSTIKNSTLTKASNSDKMNRYRIEVIRDGSGNGTVKVYDDSLSTVGTTGTLDATAHPNSLPFRIGSSYNAALAGHTEWNDLLLVEGIGTAQQIADQWEQIIATATAQGIDEGD